MFRALFALGSNLGHRKAHIDLALELLKSWVTLLRSSSYLSCAPLVHPVYDTSDHEEYLNLIVEGRFEIPPYELYKHIYEIENKIGHNRKRAWAPREIDIDILCVVRGSNPNFLMNELYVSQSDDLVIPHHGLFERRFIETLLNDISMSLEDLKLLCKKN